MPLAAVFSILAAWSLGEPDTPSLPPAPEFGYSMQEDWDTMWRRVQDRSARGDDLGPYLQRRPDLARREYPLTLAVADFPMRWERAWVNQASGARFWMHSDDEFFFLNRVQVKQRTAMGKTSQIGLRYDRLEGRTIRSSILRLDFRWPNINKTGVFVEIRAFLRATKPDLDAEVAVGQHFGWGRVLTRVIVFDPITNASWALVQGRQGEQERELFQETATVGWTFEAQTKDLKGVHAEAYVGSVIPNRLRVEYGSQSEDPEADYLREQSATMAGGLVEYAMRPREGRKTMHAGASGTYVRTEHHVDFDDPERPSYDAPERDAIVQAWWLGHFGRDLDLQVRGRYSRTKLGTVTQLAYRRIELDEKWLAEARATWLFTRPFGMELGYSVLKRELDGPEEITYYIAGTDHRALIRFVLRFRHSFWVAFGAGLDLDRGGEVYDQGGMTMVLRW